MNEPVQVEVWAEVESENFLSFRRKLHRLRDEVRRETEEKMAETTRIGGISEDFRRRGKYLGKVKHLVRATEENKSGTDCF